MSSVWHAPVGSFQAERPHTLAIYCSDGRYAEACDWFIEHVLGGSRFDQFAVPGGAAWLRLDYDRVWEHELARRYLRFLIEEHAIRRVILIAHERCAFYLAHGVKPDWLYARQLDDLRFAQSILTDWYPSLRTEAYYRCARKRTKPRPTATACASRRFSASTQRLDLPLHGT
jgi:hypothetical protein